LDDSRIVSYCGYTGKKKKKYLKFSINFNNLYLNSYPYSEYQKYIFRQIIKFRKIGYSDRKISNYFNDNGIKTTRGKNSSFGLVWMLRKKYYKSKLREQNNPNGKIINKKVIEE